MEESNHNSLPELFSKTVIVAFSCFFSTIFGAVLLMYNMGAVNQPKGRTQVLYFGITYMFITMLIQGFFPQFILLPIIFNITGAAILNEYFWNKYIGSEIIYEPKNWTKPALYSIIVSIPILLIGLQNM